MEPPEDHSFSPANDKLISSYLRRRVAGEPLPPATAAYFHDADIYTAEPATLTEGLQPAPTGSGDGNSWLFFTPLRTKSSTDRRRSRRVGGDLGTWHSEHAAEAVVDDEGNPVGHRQLFSYKEKGGGRSGWSMWEFTAADSGGGEPVLVLCKIHQGNATSSRRGADGSAARSARKRKGADDVVDQARSVTVRRRLFAPPEPTPPAPSQGKIAAAPEAIPFPCPGTETDASKDTPMPVPSTLDESVTTQHEIGAASETTPTSRSEIEASNDTPRPVLSFWDESITTQIGAAPETTPTSARSEIEASKNTTSPVLSFRDELAASPPNMISASSRPVRSFTADPHSSQDNIVGTMMDSPASFLIPEPAASQGMGMAMFDYGFLTDRDTPPAPDHCYQESFTNGGGNMAGLPLRAPGVGGSGSWARYDTAGPCSSGNAFLGGLPMYDDYGAAASASLTGFNTGNASWSVSDAFIGGLPAHNEPGISEYAGVPSRCVVPSAAFVPSAVPSEWFSGRGFWSS